jgi:hypothetical protein
VADLSNPTISEPFSPSGKMNHILREAEKIAQQGKRGKQSLSGRNVYAEQFHDSKTLAIKAFRELQGMVSAIANPGLERTLIDIDTQLKYFFGPKTSESDRRDLRRNIDMLLKAEIEPTLDSLTKHETDFLPIEIASGTRGYVENVARQINVCFKHNALDACGVMIRRLLETLIIEVFEKRGLADRIKDAAGNYLMFADLVARLTSTPETPVGRTTRTELPKIAIILNNCAHSRTFNISRAQLVQHQTSIVIAVQELITLWDVRKSLTQPLA